MKTILKNLIRQKYLLIIMLCTSIMFAVSYYLTVMHVYENSIVYYTQLTGLHFSFVNLLLNFIVAIQFGVYIALLFYKKEIVKAKTLSDKAAGFGGATLATLAAGCSACGLPFLGFIGLPAVFSYLPWGGNELKLLGIALLAFSTYVVIKNIQDNLVCKIKR